MFRHLNSVLNEVQRLSCVRSRCKYNENARGAIHILNLRYAQVRRGFEEIEKQIKDYEKWIKENPHQTYMRAEDRNELREEIAKAMSNIERLTQERNALWLATEAEIENDTTIETEDTRLAAGDGPSYSELTLAGNESTPPQTPTINSNTREDIRPPAGKPSGVKRNSHDSSQMRELLSYESNETTQPLNAINVVKRRLNSSTSSTSSDKSTATSRLTRDTKSSTERKRTKYTTGGAIKNKRRTQKRVASRRRKRNKKTTTRRKIYTRKQKK
jgi:hypothetical protein